MINLIPAHGSADSPNYWCTWSSQNRMRTHSEVIPGHSDEGAGVMQMRQMLSEDFLFGDNGLLTNYFQGVREDLIVVLDDGWDVPAVDTSVPPRYFDDFGSMILFAERFPSFAVPGNPAESLKRLSDRIKSLGYRGLGLWVSPQIPRDETHRKYTQEEAVQHWTERAKWSDYADIKLWKVDWGEHAGRVPYREMMTRVCRQFAPHLMIEHALCQGPVNLPPEKRLTERVWIDRAPIIKQVLRYSDVFRSYDIIDEFRFTTTLARVAEIIHLKSDAALPDMRGIINIENEMYIGAALGCSLGVMKHEAFFRHQPDFLPPPDLAYDEVVRALHWQRIAPPFSYFYSTDHVSRKHLVDEMDFHQKKWPYLNEHRAEDAPAVISRNTALPKVKAAPGNPSGELPFVGASKHPNGAFAVGTFPRTLDNHRIHAAIPAQVTVSGLNVQAPVGVFGEYASLTLVFDSDVEGKKVYAQDLLSGEAHDITSSISMKGNKIKIDGALIHSIGLSIKTHPEDTSAPGLVLALR